MTLRFFSGSIPGNKVFFTRIVNDEVFYVAYICIILRVQANKARLSVESVTSIYWSIFVCFISHRL